MAKKYILNMRSTGKTWSSISLDKASAYAQTIHLADAATLALVNADTGMAPTAVAVQRVGQALHIRLDGTDPTSPSDVIVENFFTYDGSSLMGQAEPGQYYDYITTSTDPQGGHLLSLLPEGSNTTLTFGEPVHTAAFVSEDRQSIAVLPLLALSAVAAGASTSSKSSAPADLGVLGNPPVSVQPATIDLGTHGKLIAPIQVEGKWYYFWDVSGDGSAGTADKVSHNLLDGIFRYDAAGNLNVGSETDNTYRYATINGVKLGLPTYDGPDSLLAIWDSQNGTGTTGDGLPPGWGNSASNSDPMAYYWTATYSSVTAGKGGPPGFVYPAVMVDGHSVVGLDGYNAGKSDAFPDDMNFYVALQIL